MTDTPETPPPPHPVVVAIERVAYGFVGVACVLLVIAVIERLQP